MGADFHGFVVLGRNPLMWFAWLLTFSVCFLPERLSRWNLLGAGIWVAVVFLPEEFHQGTLPVETVWTPWSYALSHPAALGLALFLIAMSLRKVPCNAAHRCDAAAFLFTAAASWCQHGHAVAAALGAAAAFWSAARRLSGEKNGWKIGGSWFFWMLFVVFLLQREKICGSTLLTAPWPETTEPISGFSLAWPLVLWGVLWLVFSVGNASASFSDYWLLWMLFKVTQNIFHETAFLGEKGSGLMIACVWIASASVLAAGVFRVRGIKGYWNAQWAWLLLSAWGSLALSDRDLGFHLIQCCWWMTGFWLLFCSLRPQSFGVSAGLFFVLAGWPPFAGGDFWVQGWVHAFSEKEMLFMIMSLWTVLWGGVFFQNRLPPLEERWLYPAMGFSAAAGAFFSGAPWKGFLVLIVVVFMMKTFFRFQSPFELFRNE